MAINILLVEDSRYKRDRIIDHILNDNNSIKIDEAYSFTSGWQKLIKKEYDLIILDMSLPTYDKTEQEQGGKFRTFGGRELARKLIRHNISSNFLFITQYRSFSDTGDSHTLQSLEKEFEQMFDKQYLGIIYFDTSSTLWKAEVTKTINKLILK